jgi:hypothetical protein
MDTLKIKTKFILLIFLNDQWVRLWFEATSVIQTCCFKDCL